VKKVEVKPEWPNRGLNLSSLTINFTEDEVTMAGCDTTPLLDISGSGFSNMPGSCGTPASTAPVWANTAAGTCEVENGQFTGYLLTPQKDQNPDSGTYGQTRTNRTLNTAMCPLPAPRTYKNTEILDFVARNNCPTGYIGEQVLFSVAAGQFTSTVNQADAQLKAQAYFDANKQAYANENAVCSADEYFPVYNEFGCFMYQMQKANGIPRRSTLEENQIYAVETGSDGQPCLGAIE